MLRVAFILPYLFFDWHLDLYAASWSRLLCFFENIGGTQHFRGWVPDNQMSRNLRCVNYSFLLQRSKSHSMSCRCRIKGLKKLTSPLTSFFYSFGKRFVPFKTRSYQLCVFDKLICFILVGLVGQAT